VRSFDSALKRFAQDFACGLPLGFAPLTPQIGSSSNLPVPTISSVLSLCSKPLGSFALQEGSQAPETRCAAWTGRSATVAW
jgi:hypothetical protein